MTKKFIFIILSLFTLKINCAELEVYEGFIIIEMIDKDDFTCFDNSNAKFIVNQPEYNKFDYSLMVDTLIIGIDDFETNPWKSKFCKFAMIACCCTKKLPLAFNVRLPLNFFKKNDRELKSNGDRIYLQLRDTKNKIVRLILEIIDRHGVLNLSRNTWSKKFY